MAGKRFFSCPHCTDRLERLPSFLFLGTIKHFLRGQSGWDVKPTTPPSSAEENTMGRTVITFVFYIMWIM
jgi:hypothetical protein